MNHQQGDIAIYTAIFMAMLMLGSAMLLGIILARQLSLTQNLISSEKAFFAANAGREHALYDLAAATRAAGTGSAPAAPGPVAVAGTIIYQLPSGAAVEAHYQGELELRGNAPCGVITGRYPAPGGEVRRLEEGGPTC